MKRLFKLCVTLIFLQYRKMFLSPAPRLNSTADRESLKQKVADYITVGQKSVVSAVNSLSLQIKSFKTQED